MTESTMPPSASAPPPAPVSSRAPRWMRVTLALSLALNLAVLGVVGGAALKGYRDGGPPRVMRDLGVGMLAEALPRESRKALAEAFRAQAPDRRERRRAWARDFDGLLAALRAEPFRPEAIQASLDGITQAVGAQRALGQEIVVDHIAGMTPQVRAKFADNLAESRKKRGQRGADTP